MVDRKKDTPKHGARWWILHRHHDLELKQSETRPEFKTEQGQRQGRVLGPFRSEEEAQKKLDSVKSRTTRHQMEAGR